MHGRKPISRFSPRSAEILRRSRRIKAFGSGHDVGPRGPRTGSVEATQSWHFALCVVSVCCFFAVKGRYYVLISGQRSGDKKEFCTYHCEESECAKIARTP